MDERTAPGEVRKPPTASIWQWVGDVLFVAGLAAVIAYAYAPSLDHAHRADQWYYLLDTMDRDGFVDTFLHTYSYNRMTKIAPGDRALFRPVLFAVLAAERSWFGYEPRGWHVVGIVLHAIVVALFFLVARTLCRDASRPQHEKAWQRLIQGAWQLVPYVLTAFFALNFAIIEQVIWSHVNSYMVFLALVLGAALLLFRTRAGNPNRTRLAVVWTLLLIAAFTYETGQVIAVLMAGYVFLGRKSTRPALAALAFCCIPIVYQAANRIDIVVHRTPAMDNDESMRLSVLTGLDGTYENINRYVRYVGMQPFEDGQERIKPGSRIRIGEPDYAANPPPIESLCVWAVLAAFVVAGVISAAVAVFREGLQSERFLRMAVLCGLLGLQIGVIVLGRLKLRGHGVLADNSYYAYPALCLLLLVVCQGMRTVAGLRISWVGLPAAVLLFVVLGMRAVDDVHVVRVANKRMRDWSHQEVNRIRRLQDWIAERGAEPGFSLAINLRQADEFMKVHGIPRLCIVARRWTVGERPRYVIFIQNGHLRIAPRSDDLHAVAGRGDRRYFVVLAEPGSSYHVFRYRDGYYGVLHWDGVYDPRRAKFHYLITGSSVARVRSQERAMLKRQAEDTAQGRFVPPTMIRLALEGYKGYNILRVGNRYYAILQGDGAFSRSRFLRGQHRDAVDGPDLESVKQRINAKVTQWPAGYSRVPILVQPNYRKYNIIQLGGRFYGIRQDDGAFDLDRYRRGRYRAAVEGAGLPEVKRRINELSTTAAGERNRS